MTARVRLSRGAWGGAHGVFVAEPGQRTQRIGEVSRCRAGRWAAWTYDGETSVHASRREAAAAVVARAGR